MTSLKGLIGWTGPTQSEERERGSAVAEFVMVAGLVVLVAMAVFQLGVALYVRNTLIASASEGARYGARFDAVPADGVTRTRELITTAVGASFAGDVSVSTGTTVAGVEAVEVTVRAPLPVLGPIGPSGVLIVSGRAFRESQVVGGPP